MRAAATIERPAEGSAPVREPSTAWIWFGSVVAVLGVAVSIVWAVIGVTGYLERVNGLARMSVPGRLILQVPRGDDRFVYLEARRPASIGQLGIRVTGPKGDAVPLSPYRLDLRYDAPGGGGRIGRALATFQASESGPYRVSATGAAAAASRIAIGESVARDVVPTLLGILALLLLTGGLGVVLIVVTLIRRSRARSRAMLDAA